MVWLILVPVGLALLLSFIGLVEYRALAKLRLRPIEHVNAGNEPQIKATIPTHRWAAERGFAFAGYYTLEASVLSGIVAAWQHPDRPTYFCQYFVSPGLKYDFQTEFARGVSLCTSDIRAGHSRLRPALTYQQSFPGAALEELWQKHKESEDYLATAGGASLQQRKITFAQCFLDAVRQTCEFRRSIMLWPLVVGFRSVFKKQLPKGQTVRDLHLKGMERLPNEVGADAVPLAEVGALAASESQAGSYEELAAAALNAVQGQTDPAAIVEMLGGEPIQEAPGDQTQPPDEVILVEAELSKLNTSKKGLVGQLVALGISLVAFYLLGLLKFTLPSIAMITGVLAVHEFGHWVGMKILGYRNVRILFIPLFGAATSGVPTRPSGAKEAVISLLGPVPGLLIGTGLAVMYLVSGGELLLTASFMFLGLNLFNLLPISPLDGGRVFENTLFLRVPIGEMVFKVIGALALGLIAIGLEAPFLGVFAFFMLVSARSGYRNAKTAHRIRKGFAPDSDMSADHIPTARIPEILDSLPRKMREAGGSGKALALSVRNIWQKACTKPASVASSVGMIALYIWSVVFGLLIVTGLVGAGQYDEKLGYAVGMVAFLVIYLAPIVLFAIVAGLCRLVRGPRQKRKGPEDIWAQVLPDQQQD